MNTYRLKFDKLNITVDITYIRSSGSKLNRVTKFAYNIALRPIHVCAHFGEILEERSCEIGNGNF